MMNDTMKHIFYVAAMRAIFALAMITPPALFAQAAPGGLAGSSLEELMNIEVTSVSKKEQALSKTAAAVYVIGQEDIRRSGASNIPDLLRMAPGVEVAQIDGNQWAISVRGFNGIYSNKVLVLIDGRAVYVSTFSGVYWDEMDVPLENIERIEIIRGPGGTVWGANAVNGVIDIITKNAVDTKGGLVTAGAGSRSSADGLAQYGGNAGSIGAYRIFGKYSTSGNSLFPGSAPAADGGHRSHGGFRTDWGLTARDTLSVQGDLLSESAGGTSSVVLTGPSPRLAAIDNPIRDMSGDVLARWDRALTNGSTSVQVYDTSIRRDEAGARIANDVADIDFEHHFAEGSRHDVVWGLDYRFTRDNVQALVPYAIHFNPPARTFSLFAAFLQDEVQLTRSLYLTLGSKVEHNAFTGFEFEPSAQLIWTDKDKHSVWISAARAVRQPDRSESSAAYNLAVEPIPGVGSAVVSVNGNPNIKAERMDDYEIGYRSQATSRVSIDLTGFASFYHRLETTEPGAPIVSLVGSSPILFLPLEFGNLARARTVGAEIFATWNVSARWKIVPAYSSMRIRVTTDPLSGDTSARLIPGASPTQQAQIRSLMTFHKNIEWDSSLKYVTSLSALNVPGYLRVDSRLGWRFLESTEISIAGQNLSSGRHVEFVDNSGLFLPTEAARAVFGKITWRM